ncbi:transcriptional regulator [Kribbella sp. ALI-6-A]|uniref:helix-turn-helix domain-containing protein n=1 Tax=Kribbella sp. ALI-6-A TaxID=1933817 RepID=UPI00097BC094|nr:helix-turn-helix transcriptional regulator [Kribbella sp. ALI-6-A]ONI72066.1 transcriptional regulator [Kribbella sp. ALI-6-A]
MAEAALEPFGVQLRRCRQAAALSLRQLATRVGYDHSYLSQVERGRRPGSAHLARLCDRELGTTGTLTQAFDRLHRPAPEPGAGAHLDTTSGGLGAPSGDSGGEFGAAASARLGATPVDLRATPVDGFASSGADLLEAVRHRVAGSFGQSAARAEWSAATAAYARDFGVTPAAELLPDLTADLDLLHRTPGPAAELVVPAAEFAVLIALTLSTVGRSRAAERWWRTARATADSSATQWIASQARSWQVISWTAESVGDRAASTRAADLLQAGIEALTLAEQPHDRARALVAQARLLAVLGRPEEARQAVRLLPPAEESPPSVFGWASYESASVASFVHTVLGDTAPAYVALDRALGLCPAERRREGAELRLLLAECLVLDGDVSTGLAMAMRTLVELEDQWHSPGLYDSGGRVLAAVQGKELTRPAVRDYRELLRRRPFAGRSVGSGSSPGEEQG